MLVYTAMRRRADTVVMSEWVVGLVAALIASALTSVVAPWVQWSIQRRKEQHTERRALIASWRKGISDAVSLDFTDAETTRSPWYTTLRPRMTVDARRELESGMRIDKVRGPAGFGSTIKTLMDEVDRLEREWGLP